MVEFEDSGITLITMFTIFLQKRKKKGCHFFELLWHPYRLLGAPLQIFVPPNIFLVFCQRHVLGTKRTHKRQRGQIGAKK